MEKAAKMGIRIPIIREPLIEVKVPQVKKIPIISLPKEKVGPIGVLKVTRVEPCTLTPVSLKPIKRVRESE
jgi:hypothetical protein